jgi:hypothetical protein
MTSVLWLLCCWLQEQVGFSGNNSGDIGLNDEEGSTTAGRFKLKLREIQRRYGLICYQNYMSVLGFKITRIADAHYSLRFQIIVDVNSFSYIWSFVLFKILVKICKIINHVSIFFSDKTNHNNIWWFFLKKDEWSNTTRKVNDNNNLETEAVFLKAFLNENKCSLLLIDP